MPRSRPTARTSSLNSSRSGSTSVKRIRSGRPPTLWWLLMTAEGPRTETDSMTSGIERALCQEIEWAESRALFFEDIDERAADDLALLLGINDSGEPIRKQLGRVDEMDRQLQPLVAIDHLFGFVVSQETVVDEDALQPIADGAMDQRRRDRRIDAARQRAGDAPSPICARMRPIDSSMNDAIVQSPVQPQTSKAKLRRMSVPCSVCPTSGWKRSA